MSFNTLNLSAEILRAITKQGYSEPTPIQRKAIPVILTNKDVMAVAQTGTGKTAAFTLPLLQLLSAKPIPEGSRPIQALVLTPTRELAAQVLESIALYGQYLPLKSTAIFGGVNINPQIAKLRRGIDILVATPGRLLDLVSQGAVNLSKVKILVLDEADRMLDMGFIRDIRKILTLVPSKRQNLLFSATFSSEIKSLANGLLNSPVMIEVAKNIKEPVLIEQIIHPVDRHRKGELLSFLIGYHNWQQVLVFTRTKHGADHLCRKLEKDGLSTAAIHGNKSQGARTKALANFKQGSVRILVATDIAARGLDIDQLPYVVNFELPHVPEDYVHRIGRTGRAGNVGKAISLVCIDELKLLKDIEHLTRLTLPKIVIPGYEPDQSIKAEVISNGRNKNLQNHKRQANGGRNNFGKRNFTARKAR